MNEHELEFGDTVIKAGKGKMGLIELDRNQIPCIHITHIFNEKAKKWVPVDNKGPIEAYQIPLFNTRKSRFYWWRKNYIIEDVMWIRSKHERERMEAISRLADLL